MDRARLVDLFGKALAARTHGAHGRVSNAEVFALGAELKSILAEESEWKSGPVALHLGPGHISEITDTLPHYLARLLMAHGPVDAVEWLFRFFARESAKIETVMPVWGISVPVEVPLTERVSLLPFSALRLSKPLETFSQSFQQAAWRIAVPVPTYISTMPTAALVARSEVSPVILTGGKSSSYDPRNDMREVCERARACLSLFGPRTLIAATTWSTFEDPELEHFSGVGFASTHYDIQPLRLRELGDFDAARAASIVPLFF